LNTVPFFMTSTEPPGREFTGVRRRRRVPVGHREDDVRLMLAREGELDDLLKRGRAGVHRARPRINDDLERRRPLRRGDEPLDAGLAQIDQLARLDQAIFAAGENALPVAGLGEAVEHRAADDGFTPAQLVVVEGELEVAIGQEGDEPLGAALAQVEGLVQPHLLEVARGQDRDEAVAVPRVKCGGSSSWRPSGTGSLTWRDWKLRSPCARRKRYPRAGRSARPSRRASPRSS